MFIRARPSLISPEEHCFIYRNPRGSKKTFDEKYYVCGNVVVTYSEFPLPAQ